MMRNRYNRYANPEPVDPGMVQVQGLQFFNPEIANMQAESLKNSQERYDASQLAIAKTLEEAGMAELREPDRAGVLGRISSNIDEIQKQVASKYEGDYGRASTEIIKSLSKSKGVLGQASQLYKEEQKYRPLYEQLRASGKLVMPGDNPFTKAAFDDKGQFVGGPDYSNIYERNDYNKWVMENISNRINNRVYDNIGKLVEQFKAENPNVKDPFLIMSKVRGASQDEVLKNVGNIVSDQDAKMFIEQNPTYAMEFGNDVNKAKEFMLQTAANQIYHQVDKQMINNPNYVPTPSPNDKSNPELNTFGAMFTQSPEDNPYFIGTKSLLKELDKKMPGEWFTGDWNNLNDIDKEIQTQLSLVNEGGFRKAGAQHTLDVLIEERNRIAPLFTSLEEYKVSKTKELEQSGQSVPTTTKEWAKLFDSDKEYHKKTADPSYTLNPLAQNGIRKQWKDNSTLVMSRAFRVPNSNQGLVSYKEIADDLDLTEIALLEQIQNSPINYNETTGEFFSAVTNKKGKQQTLYYTIDDVTSNYSIFLKDLKKVYSNKPNENKTIISPDGLLNVQYIGGSNNSFKMSWYDPTSKQYVTDNKEYSIQDIRKLIKEQLIGEHIKEVYTIPGLTYTQQEKQEN